MPDSLVINIDEEKDKPINWQRDGYSVEDINQDGFILIAQKLDTIKIALMKWQDFSLIKA